MLQHAGFADSSTWDHSGCQLLHHCLVQWLSTSSSLPSTVAVNFFITALYSGCQLLHHCLVQWLSTSSSLPCTVAVNFFITALYSGCQLLHHCLVQWRHLLQLSALLPRVQALQKARSRSMAASAEVQCMNQEVSRLQVAIPKLQLEAAAARHQATDLHHRLAQLSQAAKVPCPALPCSALMVPCSHSRTSYAAHLQTHSDAL